MRKKGTHIFVVFFFDFFILRLSGVLLLVDSVEGPYALQTTFIVYEKRHVALAS